MTHWAYSFYDFQDELTGCYAAPVHPSHHERAAEVRRDAPGLRLLELGSGGGQFAVQGPIMLQAGDALGVDPAITIMAVSYGDQWTNMIQPFWAIPLLAIAGLKMRDILGYTTIVLLASGLVFGATLLIVSL